MYLPPINITVKPVEMDYSKDKRAKKRAKE